MLLFLEGCLLCVVCCLMFVVVVCLLYVVAVVVVCCFSVVYGVCRSMLVVGCWRFVDCCVLLGARSSLDVNCCLLAVDAVIVLVFFVWRMSYAVR